LRPQYGIACDAVFSHHHGMAKILVPLCDGFEEIEGITVIDVLRRAGCEVVVAGVTDGPLSATRKTRHLTDTLLTDAVLNAAYDAIVLPGGRPGADTLAAHQGLRARMQKQHADGLWLAAICAAPLALDKAGLLGGKRFTCHPAAAQEFVTGPPLSGRVVVDGKIVTGQAAGSAMEFSLKLVELLCGSEKKNEVEKGLLF